MKIFVAIAIAILSSPVSAQVAVWRVPPQNSSAVPAIVNPGSIGAGPAAGSVAAVSASDLPVVYLATNNLDPRASVLAGIQVGGAVVGAGRVATVNMTTNGGKPANGATVWIASSMEDGDSEFTFDNPANARGKCTATKPDLSMPVYPGRRQNIALCGVVVDNSRYDVDKTVTITVAPGDGVQFVDENGDSTNTPDTTQTIRGTKLPHGSSFTADGTVSERKL